MVTFLVRWNDTDVVEDKPKIQRGDIVTQYQGEITDVISNSNVRRGVISDKDIEDLQGLALMSDETHKRNYYLDVDSLPAEWKDDLENNVGSVTYAEIMPYFKERA